MIAQPSPRASHLRGRYLLHSPWLRAWLAATDSILRVGGAGASGATSGTIRRVLVGVGGHLGDAIIATSALELLGRVAPDVELGVLTGSWSAAVFANDPRVRRIHLVDHWRLNRSRSGTAAKVAQYRRSMRQAIAEVRAAGYDAAIDLYPYYPNMAGIFWRAGIPRRAGYVTGGRGVLYTLPHEWIDDRAHIAEKQARLVRALFPAAEAMPSPSRVAPAPRAAADKVASLLEQGTRETGPLVMLHAGSGDRPKDWPPARWRELATQLSASGYRIVFTGAGETERTLADDLARDLPNAANLVGRLDWAELTALVEGADLVICGDTSVAHLAGATRTPAIVLYSGINPTEEWRPLGAPDVPCTMIMNDVPCAPCFRRDGCATMDCIRGVTAGRVAEAAREVLS